MFSAPKFSVAEAMTPALSIAEDLRIFADAGATGIGIDQAAKLRDHDAALAQFRASALSATFALPAPNAVLPFAGPEQLPGVSGNSDPRLRIDAMCTAIRTLAPFKPAACVCITGPAGDLEPERAYELAVAGLRRAARAAADAETTLAIEPIHRSLSDMFSFIATIPQAIAMLDDIGEPNTGLLIDVWHIWDSANVLDHLRDHAGRIAGVHINNRRLTTRSWCDRVLPRDGVADFDALLRAILEGGYDGWFELEVISDDGRFGHRFPDSLWALPPGDLIRRGHDQLMESWKTITRGDARPPGSEASASR